MAVTKRVGFNFFRPFTVDEGEAVFINLRHLFEEVRLKYQRAREEDQDQEYKFVYKYNDEPARLADISIDVNTQFYHLIFERLDYVLPSRTTLHGESTVIDLEEDEYIGHDASVLYDPENHILMVQRNRSSLSPSGIEKCIRSLLQEYEVAETFDMGIIKDPTAKQRALNQHAYRKIQMKVTGAKANGIAERFWGRVPQGLDVVEVILSSGPKKIDEIENEFSKEVLEQYVHDEEVQSLKIRSREEEGDTIEPIDLIDHKVQTFTSFRIDDDRQINPVKVFEVMDHLYRDEERGMRNKLRRM